MMRAQRAFTLVELLIVVALVAIVLMIAAPSFTDFILVQRLKSTNAQLVTDLQMARSVAVSRGTYGRVVFASNDSMTCYTIFVNKLGSPSGLRCDCRLGVGSACTSDNSSEIRTTQAPLAQGVAIRVAGNIDPAVAFDNVTGGLMSIPSDVQSGPIDTFTVEVSISGGRLLRTVLGRTGRPSTCAVGDNLGAPTC